MSEYLSGGLYVVERPRDRHWINRELKQIDPRLFLERQLTFDNQQVWCVVLDMADAPPLTLLEFRDDNGNAIPDPTERMVQRMAMMERDGSRLHQRVLDKNRLFQEEKKRQLMAQTRDLTLDIVPRISSTRSVILPRGQHLRRSRDRERAWGAKV